jgi:HKD family nuclease
MARIELILQAVSNTTHAATIRALLQCVNADSVLISVGFVRGSGVEAVETAIRPVAARTRFFVGIRNDITSLQGIKQLIALRAEVYAVDTGSRNTIFHPKLYLAVDNGQEARLVIGSANLTHSGLHNNIEASTLITLDLGDARDRAFVEQTTHTFDELLRRFPLHVFRIANDAAADELFEDGRLVDETIIRAPLVTSAVRKGNRDPLPRMNLHHVAHPRGMRPIGRPPAPRRGERRAGRGVPAPALPISDYYLVWQSNPLTERDLNVPTGPTTHRTGSMLWKKGAMEGIDQRHFFRDQVFEGLLWQADAKRQHLERARATFELAVKNLNYGKFTLQLTHNTLQNTASYRQNNAMTQLHWGDAALPVVARRDLLGRTMFLYRKDTNPPEFLIEID